MIPKDKLMHVAAGAMLAIAVTLVFGYPLIGLLAAAASGWAKEYIYDRARPDEHTVDVWDFWATTAGGALGALLAWWLL